MRKIGSIGDVDPINYGGGYIFSNPEQGGPWIEYFDGLDSLGFNEHEDELRDLDITVYRINLGKDGRDFLRTYDWVDWENIADFTGQDIAVYTTPYRLKSAQARALAAQDAASYYGWHEFDNYPLEITLGRLMDRWGI